MTEPNEHVLHAMGLGIAQMRGRIAGLEIDLENAAAYGGQQYAESVRQGKRHDDAVRSRDVVQRNLTALQNDYQENAARALLNLNRLDQITLSLFEYIEELKGLSYVHPVKSTRIALGHVVAKLEDIRGTDKEQD